MSKQAYREDQRVKPIGKAGIEKCREIVKERQNAKINEVMVDLYSASAIVQVYDNINAKSQANLEGRPVAQVCDLCFQVINKVNKGAA